MADASHGPSMETMMHEGTATSTLPRWSSGLVTGASTRTKRRRFFRLATAISGAILLAHGTATAGEAQDGGKEGEATAPIARDKVRYKVVGEVELFLHHWSAAPSHPEAAPPTTVDPGKTAVVFFFGGGWRSGTVEQFAPHAERLARQGFEAFSAEYRVRSRHGTTPFECVEDGKSAIRWVRSHADDFGIHPERIVAAGGSAGGHVAACTGVLEGFDAAGEDHSVSSRPNAMLLFNPVIDTSSEGYGANVLGERWRELSPLHHVRAETPPTLIFHGTADKTVPFANVEAFDAAMNEHGCRCVVVPFDGKGHGFFNHDRDGGTPFESTIERSLEFLREVQFLSHNDHR